MSTELIYGLLTGMAFGFLLQKGRVLRFDKQVAALLLKDMTIFKFMLSAIIVGMIGLGVLEAQGVLKFSHKPMNMGAIVVGGALFGVGWAVAGFCPGTSVGAVGEGRWHALFAVAGMVAGAGLFALLFPAMKVSVLGWADFGKISLPQITGLPAWLWVAGLSAVFVLAFRWFERRRE